MQIAPYLSQQIVMLKNGIFRFIYFLGVIAFFSSTAFMLAILFLSLMKDMSLTSVLDQLWLYIQNETEFFPHKIQVEDEDKPAITFIIFFYLYNIFYFVNVIPLLFHPLLVIYSTIKFIYINLMQDFLIYDILAWGELILLRAVNYISVVFYLIYRILLFTPIHFGI